MMKTNYLGNAVGFTSIIELRKISTALQILVLREDLTYGTPFVIVSSVVFKKALFLSIFFLFYPL